MAISPVEPSESHGACPSLLDRDLSILAFNARVLDWARRSDVPWLERLRYLCIVSSNLDEFFEVRMAPHLEALRHSAAAAAHTINCKPSWPAPATWSMSSTAFTTMYCCRR